MAVMTLQEALAERDIARLEARGIDRGATYRVCLPGSALATVRAFGKNGWVIAWVSPSLTSREPFEPLEMCLPPHRFRERIG